jgi:ketosteroid isomerase-like protein
VTGLGPSAPPPEDLAARVEVDAANTRFYRAFEELDLAAMERVWSRDDVVSCVHPGWQLLDGRESVMASWEGILGSTTRIRFRLRDKVVFVRGDVAWVYLVEEIEADQRGDAVHGFAQTTNIFRREEGEWRLIHHHAAPLPQREEPPPSRRAPSRTLH